MSRFQVRVITKTETSYTIDAEGPQDAVERVLVGLGDKGDEDYPEPDIFVAELES